LIYEWIKEKYIIQVTPAKAKPDTFMQKEDLPMSDKLAPEEKLKKRIG
jgi:hypothetical protein